MYPQCSVNGFILIEFDRPLLGLEGEPEKRLPLKYQKFDFVSKWDWKFDHIRPYCGTLCIYSN